MAQASENKKAQPSRRLRMILSLLGAIGLVGIDQLSKQIAVSQLMHSPPIEFFGGIFVLQYAENPGAFLSLGSSFSDPVRFWIFTLGASALLLFATVHLLRGPLNRWNCLALITLVGGGVGNLIDRANLGYVIDFLNLGIGSIRTGIFNIADMAIFLGAAILIIRSGRDEDARQN